MCNRLERTVREEMKKTVPQCEFCCLGSEGGSVQLAQKGWRTCNMEVVVFHEAGVRLKEE